MQVQSKKSYKKLVILIAAIIVIIAGGLFAYAMYLPQDHSPSETTTSDTQKAQSSEKSSKSDNDSQTTDDQTTTREKEKDNPTQFEGSSPNTNNTITGVINYKAVADGALTLRTTIEQSLTSGTCTLTLTSNGRTVTKTANIAPNPSSSTCEGFSVPVSELGSGSWNIEITITSGDRTGAFKDSVTI